MQNLNGTPSKWMRRTETESQLTLPFYLQLHLPPSPFSPMLVLSSPLSKSLLPFSLSHFFSSFHTSSSSLLSLPSPFLSSFYLPMFEIKWISELFWSVVFHYSQDPVSGEINKLNRMGSGPCFPHYSLCNSFFVCFVFTLYQHSISHFIQKKGLALLSLKAKSI